MSRVSATMNHENAWPIQVLTRSMNNSNFCMAEFYAVKKNTIRVRRMVSLVSSTSGLLRCRLARGLAEVVVVRHAAVDVGVEVPAHRARGELALRLLDLHPHRVVRALLGGCVIGGELLGEDRV